MTLLACLIAVAFAGLCAVCIIIADEFKSDDPNTASGWYVTWSLGALVSLCATVVVLSTLWWLA